MAAPVAPKCLPDPLDDRTRRLLAPSTPPEKPDMHGCAYFDGAPWDICFMCEYEKDPAGYQARIRRSNNIEKITAYFRNVRAGQAAAGWGDTLLCEIVAELDKPRTERTYTDEQLADTKLAAAPGSLLAGLRALLAFV